MMLNREDFNRPKIKSANISHELRKYHVDVTARSEVRFPESRSIREEGGYTIFWSERPSGINREPSVTLAISDDHSSKLEQDKEP